MKRSSHAQKLKKLKNEIKHLKREKAFLLSRVQAISSEGNLETVPDNKSYFAYLKEKIKSHSIYRIFEKGSRFFSKFRLIALIFKIISFVTIAIQTSAFIFIAIVVILIILPPIVIGFAVIFICSAARYSHDTADILEAIKGKKIMIIFTQRHFNFQSDSFFYRNALNLTSRGYTVIAVSPFMLSSKGISGSKDFYLNRKREADGIFTLRLQYYFFIKKKIFEKHRERLIYIY